MEVYSDHLTDGEVKKLKFDQPQLVKLEKKNTLVLEEIVDEGGTSKKSTLILEELVEEGGTSRPQVVSGRGNRLFFRKRIMAKLNGGRNCEGDRASEGNGAELNGSGVSMDGRTSKLDGANNGGGAELNRDRANGTAGPIANGIRDGETSKGSGAEVNGGEANRTGRPIVNGVGSIECFGTSEAGRDCECDRASEGDGASKDGGDELNIGGASKTDDHMDYGCSDIYESQGVEHEGTGAAGSPGANYGGADSVLDDTQCWELNSNLGSSEDKGVGVFSLEIAKDLAHVTRSHVRVSRTLSMNHVAIV
ncbi:hypothetical protein ACH5RR_037115 [Cinchona calisaya]|uniref:Uncharacterized protein n=1 Tax=Cinchona calisaya TaxID=153742 RepID=A0ABD2Y6K6_9GENT